MSSDPPLPLEAQVRGYLDHLAVERGLAKNTLMSYRRDLRRYLEFLVAAGKSSLVEVSERDVADFLAVLRQGGEQHPPLSVTSAARTIVAVRGLHKFAVREGTVDADAAGAVRPPTPARRLPKAIPVEDVERLLDAAGSGGHLASCATARCSNCSTEQAPASRRRSVLPWTTSTSSLAWCGSSARGRSSGSCRSAASRAGQWWLIWSRGGHRCLPALRVVLAPPVVPAPRRSERARPSS